MSEAFDAYHQWLGIPPKYQPPDHYRLLGVEQFEDDADVISDAAERQIAHVRRKSLSQHSSLSQKLLNELGAAKACLIHPDKKKEYDVALRKRLLSTTKQTVPSADAQKSQSRATDSRMRQASPSPIAPRNSAVTESSRRNSANVNSAGSPATPILVECRCGQRFLAEPYLAGSMVSCLKCGSKILVSAPRKPTVDNSTAELSTPWSTDLDLSVQSFGDPLGNWQQIPAPQNRPDAGEFQEITRFLKRAVPPKRVLLVAAVIAGCAAVLIPLGLGVQWIFKFAKKPGFLTQPSITKSNVPQSNTPQPHVSQPNNSQRNILPHIPFTVKSRHSESIAAGTPLEIRARERVPLPPSAPLRFEIQPGYPQGVTLNETTGVVNWTPTEDQGLNNYTFMVNAIIPESGHTVLELTIHVFVRERRPRLMEPNGPPGPPRKSVRF